MARTRARPNDDSSAGRMYALNPQFQSNQHGEPSRTRRSAAPSAGPSFPGGVDALAPTPRAPSPVLAPQGPRQQFRDPSYLSGGSQEDADPVGQERNVLERMDSSDDDEPDYSPGRTNRSRSSATNHSNCECQFVG
ncbi:hypothetical protein F5880DRAFT_1619743 [Lentinula raphanica]|nr:hypothetical protein F5880DRAFT_1619743 [Lentinula raphanica]